MGHAFQSPLRRWDVIAGLCSSIEARTFVEVGAKDGRTTGFVLANCPDIRAIAIDPWVPVANSAEDYGKWDFAEIERQFWQNVGEHKGRVRVLRQASLEAARDITGAPFDVVFIDAAHDYENVIADVNAWWPLVREGGYLCFHDFNHKWPAVMRAVAACFPLMKVAVCPDSMAVVQKDATLRVAA